MPDNKDVDLYKELEDALAGDQGDDTPGASAESDKGDDDAAPADDKKPEDKGDDDGADNDDDGGADGDDGELTEEEISKLSPRAQKRIRSLAKENADLKKPADSKTDGKKEDEKEDAVPEEFDSIEDFLAAVKDEPSRKLLEMFAKVIDKSQSSKIQPLLEKSASELFDQKFAAYEHIEGMADHKEDLRKTFMRNPSQDLKQLVGATLVDLHGSKIKPTERKPSTPNHGGGKVDLDGLSKEQLYDQLESLKE